MKMLFDLFPVLLFFIAFQIYGIYVATAVAIAATFVQIGWLWIRGRKIDKMLWVSLVVITLFGGATLVFKDDTFIKWKPTVLYWLFGGALIVAWVGFRKNLVRSIMEHQVALPEEVGLDCRRAGSDFLRVGHLIVRRLLLFGRMVTSSFSRLA